MRALSTGPTEKPFEGFFPPLVMGATYNEAARSFSSPSRHLPELGIICRWSHGQASVSRWVRPTSGRSS